MSRAWDPNWRPRVPAGDTVDQHYCPRCTEQWANCMCDEEEPVSEPTFTTEGADVVRLDIGEFSHRYLRTATMGWVLEESCRDGVPLDRPSRAWDLNDSTTTGLEDLPARLSAALTEWDSTPCQACGLELGVDGTVIFNNEADRAETVHKACPPNQERN